MAMYDNYENGNVNSRQRDFVLHMNEYAYILNKTDGNIKSAVGPYQTSLSQQETPVIFNTKTKRFEECSDYEKSKQLFVSAPEGWYVVLKNPTKDGQHPQAGRPNQVPTNMIIGKKVNIFGPTSFALFPGQMAKVVQGHRLRSNQYLLARVYDADAAKEGMNSATMIDTEGNEVENKAEEFFAGQLLVIKGTEVSFYIPPTGIEVIPIDSKNNNYVRDAVTLERLEYAILKDEDGEKRYIHGPSVVFPKPTETFVKAPKGGNIFRALELSPISGIYIKVIAAYDEEVNGKKVHHPIGEELFITGKEQMIYYPRPEHAMIEYDGKYMHHAIAIPEGEGRYILNRLTGEIKTVVGPHMYLPDPRVEVVVKRKLSEKECQLYYPNNIDVLAYNRDLTEKNMEKKSRKGISPDTMLNYAYSTSNQEATLAIFEANANISRGVSYTKPRTITLETKYEGVVSINVWSGYAVKVVSKRGTSEVITGPATRLLDYDETLEVIKNGTEDTVYLPLDNNLITDTFEIQTSDYVNTRLKLMYNVSFDTTKVDSWFNIYDYQKNVCTEIRTIIKNELKNYSIQELCENPTEIISSLVLDYSDIIFNNGIIIDAIELIDLEVEKAIAQMLENYKEKIVREQLSVASAAKNLEAQDKIIQYSEKLAEIEHQETIAREERLHQQELATIRQRAEIAREKELDKLTSQQAEVELQELLNVCHKAKMERIKTENELDFEQKEKDAALEKRRQEVYASTIATIFDAISPDLTAALNSNANADMMQAVSKAVSPYAIAKGESISDTVNTLLRGTSLEGVIDNLTKSVKG